MDSIVGHKKVITYLKKAAETGRFPHSLVFAGPKNVGKTTVARHFAAKLLGAEETRIEAHPDFFQVEPDGVISKEEIDAVIERIKFSAWGGGYKIALINDAERMTLSAANTFLKTMEEPPLGTVIILLTSELNKILPTIVSRSVILQFRPVAKNDIKIFLKEKYPAQDVKISHNLAFGRPGKILEILEKQDWQKIYENQINEFFHLFFGAFDERLKTARNIFGGAAKENKNIILGKIDFWLSIIRDMIFLKYKLNDITAYFKWGHLLEEAERGRTMEDFTFLASRLIKIRTFPGNFNLQLLLENLIL